MAEAEKTLSQAQQEAARIVEDARTRTEAARQAAARLEQETDEGRAELLAAAEAEAGELMAAATARALTISEHCSALLDSIKALEAALPVGEER